VLEKFVFVQFGLRRGKKSGGLNVSVHAYISEYESFFDYIARFLFWIRDSKVQT